MQMMEFDMFHTQAGASLSSNLAKLLTDLKDCMMTLLGQDDDWCRREARTRRYKASMIMFSSDKAIGYNLMDKRVLPAMSN